MKKSRKKKGERKKKLISNKVKKTFPYQLLKIALIALVILILIWVFLFVSGKISYFPKDEEGKWTGEFATLKWDFDQSEIILDILNYAISEDNLTIDVNINWSSGDKDIGAILIDFLKPEGNCNYTTSDLMSLGENKTYYAIDSIMYCDTGDFANVTGVRAYAQVHINLTQIALIEDIILYDDDSLIDVIDLDDYFFSLVNISYSIVENPDNDYVLSQINDATNKISFIRGAGWHGTQEFNLTASEIGGGGDILDVITSGENMSFSVIFISGNRAINNAPEFDEEECEEFIWEKGKNLTVDMDDCWDDEDEDDLNLSYGSLNTYRDNINVIDLDGNEIKFVPNITFTGRTYLYFYAEDYDTKSSHKVYINISEIVSSDTDDDSNDSDEDKETLKIITTSPSSTTISMLPDTNKSFSISAQNYETIKWYLDDDLISGETGLSYNFAGLEEGEHTIKAEIINGTNIDSKTWNIIIEKDETGDAKLSGAGKVIFYSIITIVTIIIMLIVWLFIVEKNSKNKKINYIGFGVNPKPKDQPKPSKGFEGRGPHRFNIPTR